MRMSTSEEEHHDDEHEEESGLVNNSILPPRRADSAYHGPETGATSVSLIVIAKVFTVSPSMGTTMVDTAVMMITTMTTVMNMMKTNTRMRRTITTRMNTRKKATVGTAKMRIFHHRVQHPKLRRITLLDAGIFKGVNHFYRDSEYTLTEQHAEEEGHEDEMGGHDDHGHEEGPTVFTNDLPSLQPQLSTDALSQKISLIHPRRYRYHRSRSFHEANERTQNTFGYFRKQEL